METKEELEDIIIDLLDGLSVAEIEQFTGMDRERALDIREMYLKLLERRGLA